MCADISTTLAVLQFLGIVTRADLNSGLEDHDHAAKQYSLLMDLGAVQDYTLTSDDIREAPKQWGSGVSKCVIVATRPVAFGLARMYEMQSGNPQIIVSRMLLRLVRPGGTARMVESCPGLLGRPATRTTNATALVCFPAGSPRF
jgi:hypothetical protein